MVQEVKMRSKGPEMSSSEDDSSSEYEEPPLKNVPNIGKESDSESTTDSEKESPPLSSSQGKLRPEPKKGPPPPPQQSKSESDSDEDSDSKDESEYYNDLSRVKQELSSRENEDENEDETPFCNDERDPCPSTSVMDSVENERDASLGSDHNIMVSSASQQAASILSFEQEHVRVSAPVVDIPSDSRVWVLHVPRSIPAAELKGQLLPKIVKGGEVLNLSSGRWNIVEQLCDSKKSLSCILSTGHLTYGIRCLEPSGYWLLKKISDPINLDGQELPLREAIPFPIKKLLKNKRKRMRDMDVVSDVPSNRSKLGILKVSDSGNSGSRKRTRDDDGDETPRKKKIRRSDHISLDNNLSGTFIAAKMPKKIIESEIGSKHFLSGKGDNLYSSFESNNCKSPNEENPKKKRKSKELSDELKGGKRKRDRDETIEKTKHSFNNAREDSLQESQEEQGSHLQYLNHSEKKRKKHSKQKEQEDSEISVRKEQKSKYVLKDEPLTSSQDQVQDNSFSGSQKKKKKHKHKDKNFHQVKIKQEKEDSFEGEATSDFF